MKIKFNKFERVAGLFVLTAVVGVLVVSFVVALKKGWFSSKVSFQTVLKNAEGIYEGTSVQIAGLQAGSVKEVELITAKEVRVRFEIFEKFHKRVREDSQTIVVRPFVIGDKVIDITVGSEDQKMLEAGSMIPSEASYDLMDLLSGRRLGPFLENLDKIMMNMKILVEAFTERRRIESIVRIFDEIDPLVKNMNKASKGFIKLSGSMNREKRMDDVMKNLSVLTSEMAEMLPEFKKEVPNMGQQLGQLIQNMNELTAEFKKLTPAIVAVAPDLPRASLRAVEALDEAVILLKAMQRSFLISGSVKEVKAEEAKLKKKRKKLRVPAQEGQRE